MATKTERVCGVQSKRTLSFRTRCKATKGCSALRVRSGKGRIPNVAPLCQLAPANYRALQNQVRELHRLLGKKTLEAEILKEALEHATGSKKQLRLPPSPPKDGSR